MEDGRDKLVGNRIARAFGKLGVGFGAPVKCQPFLSSLVIRNKGRLLLGRQNFVIGGAKEKGRETRRSAQRA